MSIQGCAAAMHVVTEVRDVLADCKRQGLNASDTLELVEFALDDIYKTADAGYW